MAVLVLVLQSEGGRGLVFENQTWSLDKPGCL